VVVLTSWLVIIIIIIIIIIVIIIIVVICCCCGHVKVSVYLSIRRHSWITMRHDHLVLVSVLYQHEEKYTFDIPHATHNSHRSIRSLTITEHHHRYTVTCIAARTCHPTRFNRNCRRFTFGRLCRPTPRDTSTSKSALNGDIITRVAIFLVLVFMM